MYELPIFPALNTEVVRERDDHFQKWSKNLGLLSQRFTAIHHHNSPSEISSKRPNPFNE